MIQNHKYGQKPDEKLNKSYSLYDKLYDDGMDRQAKVERTQKQKEITEIIEAYNIAQQPILNKNMNSKLNKSPSSNSVRSCDQFMEDVIRYEQKKYENLKKSIVR